ncbi:MAG: peptidoglycan DD-metalloendopeptidase family protein [bacterium]|nr:MAG: peptidoglycan DD-metalloendopeptidase family protein [bacterium]
MRRSLVIPFVALVVLMAPAARSEGPSGDIEGAKEKLENIQKRMGTAQERIKESEKRERSILGSIEALDREIGSARRKIRDLNTRERDLKEGISASESRIRDIRRQREKTAGWLSLRSAALYKAGRLSYLRIILNSTGIEDLQRRSYYLKMLAESDSELFNLSTELYKSQQSQVEALKSAKDQLISTRRDQEESLAVLARKKREKDLILAAARDQKDKNATLLRELESSASHLEKMLSALELQAKTGESAFATLKGSLKKPVSGKVVRSFGRNRTGRFNTYTISNGVTIQSAEGTPIRSVYNGKVIFADWFSGYGRIIILDHGGGYYTLYGHLSELKVAAGDEIEADRIIGLVGDSGSLEGPALYFEIRLHGKPVNPSPWFKG